MKCVKCGTAVQANEKFCSECGAPAITPPASAQTTNFCQDCGCKLDAAEKFCSECGISANAIAPEIDAQDKKVTVSKTFTQSASVIMVAPVVPQSSPKPAALKEPVLVALAKTEPPKTSAPDAMIADQKVESVPPQPTPQPATPQAAGATPSGIKPKSSPQPEASRPPTIEQPKSNAARKAIYGILGLIVAALVGLVVIGPGPESKAPDATREATVQPAADAPARGVVAPQPAVASVATASSDIVTNSAQKASAVPVADAAPEPVQQPTTYAIVEAKRGKPTGTPVLKLVAAAVDGRKDEFQELLQELQRVKETGSVNSVERKQARKLNDEALQAMKEEKHRLSVELLQRATKMDPYDIEIADNLGYVLRLDGKYLESEAQILSVIERSPARGLAWFNLGETYSKLGRNQQAIAIFVTSYSLSKKPERTMEMYISMADKAGDDQFRANLKMAIKKINSFK